MLSTTTQRPLLNVALACLAALALPSLAHAATITLAGSDALNSSSFNAGTNWTGGATPAAGNDYVIGTGLRLRTPASDFTGTFAGDSLTVANGFSSSALGTDANDLFGFSFKGTGSTGVVTVSNLILAGGSINHIGVSGVTFNLAGGLTITADSMIRAKQGAITISSSIAGTSNLYIGKSDNGGYLITFAGTNTFTGSVFLTDATSKLTIAGTSNLGFVIGASGVNNSVSGAGVATFDGTFSFDLSGASSSAGDSWTISSAATTTYGSTFSVAGFTQSGTSWVSGAYVFSEDTGILSVVPEPSTYAALLAVGAMGTAILCRRRRA